MKKSKKRALQIALLLCIAGMAIWFVCFVVAGFKLTKISTVTYETNTYEIQEEFYDIEVRTKTADVSFVAWEEETCKIVCHEEERMKHSAEVKNGTLMITVTGARKWYDNIGMSFDHAELTIYLPKMQYDTLQVRTQTGAVEVPEDFRFETAKAKTDTGKISWKAPVDEELTLETDTGDISVDTEVLGGLTVRTSTGETHVASVKNTSRVYVQSDTGEVLLQNMTCRFLEVKTDTGKVRIEDIVAEVSSTITTETGHVILERFDALEGLYVTTDTGDVDGTLLSEKQFLTETDTGRVNVPKTVDGGLCSITTDTGDINIEVIGQ